MRKVTTVLLTCAIPTFFAMIAPPDNSRAHAAEAPPAAEHSHADHDHDHDHAAQPAQPKAAADPQAGQNQEKPPQRATSPPRPKQIVVNQGDAFKDKQGRNILKPDGTPLEFWGMYPSFDNLAKTLKVFTNEKRTEFLPIRVLPFVATAAELTQIAVHTKSNDEQIHYDVLQNPTARPPRHPDAPRPSFKDYWEGRG